NNDLPDSMDSIFTDSIKLKTILSILIGNAIKFTKEGSIEFGYDRVETSGRGSLQMKFYVKDTGIGIPENKQQVIFEQFMQADVCNTRQFEGSGLGLSIAKAYVEMLGGEIWVESSEGKGSIFYFTIPCNG
ncbi:MAG TPA: ATP-binding protein, partial [Paludibacter sp.]